MFRDLFDVLVEFLSVDSDEDPFGVRRVAVEGAGGVVAKVFVVFSSGVVWVDVLREFSIWMGMCECSGCVGGNE